MEDRPSLFMIGNGNLTSISDARGNITTYTYDNMDRLVGRTDPLSASESYSYDLAGNETSFVDKRGKKTVFQYDGLNRLVFSGYGAPTYESTIAYTFDSLNGLTKAIDSLSLGQSSEIMMISEDLRLRPRLAAPLVPSTIWPGGESV